MDSISKAMTAADKTQSFLGVFSDCDIITTDTELLCKTLDRDGSLRVKFGVDPTATELHLGWMVPLLRLKKIQELGHTVILVIGDFTATIGDPSGKSSTRKQLTADEVKKNTKNLLHQFGLVLDMSNVEVRFNSSWSSMPVSEFIGLCSSVTVSQIMERNDFSGRFENHESIALHEILYPILQARDSVFIDCDVEIGGTDQRFSCLLGRDIMSSVGMKPQAVILTPLLVGLDGVRKMSQSLGNFISIRDQDGDMFGKVMSIPDNLMHDWWKLLQLPGFDQFVLDSESGMNPKDLKIRLATEIVTLCHGVTGAQKGLKMFTEAFVNRNWQDTAPEIILSSSDEIICSLAVLMVERGMSSTNSEARRLIQSGAVEIGGVKMINPTELVTIGEMRGKHLKVGKRRFAKLV